MIYTRYIYFVQAKNKFYVTNDQSIFTLVGICNRTEGTEKSTLHGKIVVVNSHVGGLKREDTFTNSGVKKPKKERKMQDMGEE